MVVNTSAIQNLCAVGLSEYEAKAYIALLRESPVSAYETAKNAGIPTAKIYGVLAKLLEREMVIELKEEGRKQYAPLEAEEYIRRYRTQTESTLDSLEADLKTLSSGQELSYIWNITGYDSFTERGELILGEAEETILLSAWPEELEGLAGTLREKDSAGVKIAVVLFGGEEPIGAPGKDGGGGAAWSGGEKTAAAEIPGQVFPHPIADTLYEEKGGRGFAAVADGREAIMGTIKNDGSVEGAWSSNAGFVTLAEDYIKHDIYIMKIVARFNRELVRRFGTGYRRLRDIFSDTEEEEKDGGSVYRRRVVRKG
jgi:HTH-type transcriptional regulator, sugar sensing transcriptional regulator